MRSRTVFFTVLVLVFVSLWASAAPTALGGTASYVITAGNSMEPLYHDGDLVVLREADSYEVGDIAGFIAADLKQIVLHRILELHGAAFTTKGDNNSWIDPYRPRAEHFLGTAWIHVPGLGKVLVWLRQPLPAGIIVASTFLLLIWNLVPQKRRRRLTILEAQ